MKIASAKTRRAVAIQWLNHSDSSVPKARTLGFLALLFRELKRRKIKASWQGRELCIVFLNRQEAKALNRRYRKKNRATDILSFPGDDELFGELVICPDVIREQAKEHGLLLREELAYMLLHGVLHLLGYDHEGDARQAKKMFRLQDAIWEKLKVLA